MPRSWTYEELTDLAVHEIARLDKSQKELGGGEGHEKMTKDMAMGVYMLWRNAVAPDLDPDDTNRLYALAAACGTNEPPLLL